MLAINLLILLITFYLLAIICDDFFVASLEKISEKLNLSAEITWATFMAIWSSAPELFTSIFALFTIFWTAQNNASLGAGTIVGSAIFNILIIIGATAIFMNKRKNKKSNKISRQPIVRDLLFYSLTIWLLLFTFYDGKIVLRETILFIVFYLFYLFIVSKRGKRFKYVAPELTDTEDVKDAVELVEKKFPVNKRIIKWLKHIIPNPDKWTNRFRRTFVISITIIAVLSHFMVNSAVGIANILNIPKAIIWLTILAAGTSIPDLISSIIVAKKGKWDMAISNAIWSNIFDILFWLGLVYFIYLLVHKNISYIPIDTHNLNSSVILLFATAITLLWFLIIQKRKINKIAGFVLIGVYLVYLGYKIFIIL